MNKDFTSNPNCGIVFDLLPLYHDGIASQSSKIYVETHMKCCPECLNKYEDMKQKLPVSRTDTYSTQTLFKKALRNQILKRVTVCVLSLVLAFTVIIGLWFAGDTVPIKILPVEDTKLHLAHRFENNGKYSFFILYSHAAYRDNCEPVVSKDGSVYRLDIKTPLLSARLEPYSLNGNELFILEDAEDCKELYFGDTLVWSEAENGEDTVPEYVYAYADIHENAKFGDGWIISAEENFAMRQYAEIGLMKIWNLEGNLLYEGFKQEDGSYSDMPDDSPETLKDIFIK